MKLVANPATLQHLTPWEGPGGDRRWTTVGFLDICSPAIAELYGYWNRKRGERPMPQRSEIDPADITRHLPGLQLIEVKRDPLDFVYRLVGTREVSARGHDPTGRRVAESFFGQTAEDVLANYRRVVATGSFVYDLDKFTTPGGRFVQDESLFLPLADVAGAVGQILVYTHYQDLWGQPHGAIAAMPAATPTKR
ncbi:MAG TPA: PAS domain-containing protein [Dongiaceae bacterium]|jgi:hypothetical protein